MELTTNQMAQRIKELEKEREKQSKAIQAAKAVWDASAFYEDENGRTDTVPGHLMLALGDALDDLVDPWLKQLKLREEKE